MVLLDSVPGTPILKTLHPDRHLAIPVDFVEIVPGTDGSPKEFSSFMGLCPGQQSSGGKTQMTGITKAGNSHLRKLFMESANSMARTTIFQKSKRLKARQSGNSAAVIAYADHGTARIRYKYNKMIKEGKNANLAKAACAREIACFVWGMMTGNINGEVA